MLQYDVSANVYLHRYIKPQKIISRQTFIITFVACEFTVQRLKLHFSHFLWLNGHKKVPQKCYMGDISLCYILSCEAIKLRGSGGGSF